MTNAVVSISLSVPNQNSGGRDPDYSTRAVVSALLNQVISALGQGPYGVVASGNLTWPPGNGQPVLGSWNYSPPT